MIRQRWDLIPSFRITSPLPDNIHKLMRFFQQLPELPIAFEEEQPANNQQGDKKEENRERDEHIFSSIKTRVLSN
jgi:hypothetical protein